MFSCLGQSLIVGTLFGQTDSTATIHGRVLEAETGLPLAGANVWISGTLVGTATDTSGRFLIKNLPIGTYALEVSYVGYIRGLVREISPELGSSQELTIKLQPDPIKLSEVVVGPGTFSITRSMGAQFQLSKLELQAIPTGINDPLRALQLLPGTNGDFLNAKIGLRGSRPDDALYLIDGMELYGDLFHLDRIQGSRVFILNGVISIIDNEIVDDLYLSLGGFPAAYGNKSGGVLGIQTVKPQRTGVEGSISLGLARMGGLLKWKVGDHSLLLSAQRGYFDLMFKLFGYKSDLSPIFYDLFAKYEYRLPAGRFFFNTLHAGDNLDLTERPGGGETIEKVRYTLTHAWSGLDLVLSPSLLSTTIFYTSLLPENIWSNATNPVGLDIREYEKKVSLYGLKQSFVYDISSAHSLEFGLALRSTSTRYFSWRTHTKPPGDGIQVVTTFKKPRGYDIGSYLSHKTNLLDNFIVTEIGIRFDHQTYIPSENRQWSPRFGAAVQLPFETVLRVGSGIYYQPDDISNLPYGQQSMSVQKTTHYLIGLENRYVSRSELRVEGYYKRLPPETKLYRYGVPIPSTGSYAYGVDVFVKKRSNRWFFWIGYAYGVSKDMFGDIHTYRSLDRRHSFSANLNVAIAWGWNFSTTFRLATGRPYTKLYLEKIVADTATYWTLRYGFYNGERGTTFSQLNINVGKRSAYSWGVISWYFQILNLLNTPGIVTYRWNTVPIGQNEYQLKDNHIPDLPRMATFGISFEF